MEMIIESTSDVFIKLLAAMMHQENKWVNQAEPSHLVNQCKKQVHYKERGL